MIEFIGPLPPPVHGFAWVSEQVMNALARQSEVHVFDRALPRLGGGYLRRLLMPWIALAQVFNFIFRLLVLRPKAVYLACSGGSGMLVDCLFIVLARMFRLPVYIHHHAFTYLNSPSCMAHRCLALMRNCQHIVLCEHMGALLAQKHSISVNNISVLTNAAFLNVATPKELGVSRRLTVGFLSNITIEKGILDFFELAEFFNSDSNGPRFLIAGPVAESLKETFSQRLAELSNVRHIGPVYGAAKDAFFCELDLLAFPTRYPNEAEPVTILEAFRAGVPVMANHRGCIATMLDESSGLGVLQAADFPKQAAGLLRQLAESPERLVILKQGALSRFVRLQSQAATKLEWLLGRIVAGAPVGGR